MAIYKLNDSLSITEKIRLLNDMLLEVNGKISNASFDKLEIDQFYNDNSSFQRKFLRNQRIGNTIGTYTGWTHVHAEGGYSIWKYSPTNYVYDSLNEFYFNGKLLEAKGEATSETATSFDKVFLYNGDSSVGYGDNTTEAGTETGTSFEVMDSSNDYLYVGLSTTFNGVKFEWDTRGANYTLKVEYWSGSAWTTLTSNTHSLVDNTSNFESDGLITWGTLTGWTTTAINSQTKYWIRISTTTEPTTVAKAYYVIPGNSVIGLLALSSSEILNEDWAWCSYTTAIYVTLRNSGNTSYEGDYYITSSSSSTNKQNYFVYNNYIEGNYADSTY